MHKMVLWAATALATAYGGAAAQAADSVVVQWNDVTLANIRTTHPGPPIVARMLMVVDTCMYNAWTAFDPVAAPTIGAATTGLAKLPAAQVTEANKTVAISYAAYRAMADMFPTNRGPADALMAALGLDPADASTDPSTPAGIGNRACAAVLAARHGDGSNQLGDLNGGAPYSDYSGYVPVNTADRINDPNRWQALRISDGHGGTVVQKYITPFWGAVTPFNAGLQLPQTEGPDLAPGAEYDAGVERILQYSAQLNDRSKVIAEYWADGPFSELPPGHWSLFAAFVSRRDGNTADQDAKMFFALSGAIFDASVQSWRIKRVYDSVRPVTAVHNLKAGVPVLAWAGPYKGTGWIDGASWQPYQAATVVTPPFPEYLSGHSIFSATGAEILKRFTGSDRFGASYTQPARSSRVEPLTVPAQAVTLTWRTFTEAANEAGLSRRYGGIHFVPGDVDGRELGHLLGAADWEYAKSFFEGRQPQ